MWKQALILATLLTAAGCSPEQPPPATQLATIDASQLRPAFASATPEAKALADDVIMSLQASEDGKALSALQALAKTPNLDTAQSNVVAGVSEQLTRRMSAAKPK